MSFDRDQFWLQPRVEGATGITSYNHELDISIGCLLDSLLRDSARLTGDNATWFRSRLKFIKQAWEHQHG